MSSKPTLESEAGKLKDDTQAVLDNWTEGMGIEWNILHLLRNPAAPIAVKCYFLHMVEQWSSIDAAKQIWRQLTQEERAELRTEAREQDTSWRADGVKKTH